MVPLVIIIVVLLIIGSGIYLYSRNKSQQITLQPTTYNRAISTISNSITATTTASTTTIITASVSTAGWHNYTNNKLGFSLSYPPDFANMADLTQEKKDSLMSFEAVCDRGTAYDGTKDPNQTNFCYVGNQTSDGFVLAAIGVQVNTPESIESCQQLRNDSPEVGQKVNINGIDYYRNDAGDGSAGHYVHGYSYSTYQGSMCYEIDLLVESDRGVSGNGLSADFSDMMLSKLQSILTTFKFFSNNY